MKFLGHLFEQAGFGAVMVLALAAALIWIGIENAVRAGEVNVVSILLPSLAAIGMGILGYDLGERAERIRALEDSPES